MFVNDRSLTVAGRRLDFGVAVVVAAASSTIHRSLGVGVASRMGMVEEQTIRVTVKQDWKSCYNSERSNSGS